MLDYKLLEALAVVVQEGGFDKAARMLHITQSAVSQRVKLLEEQTGQVLLARTTPPRATPAGRLMLKHYLQVKRLEDDLVGSLIPASSEDFVSIPVGINADSLATWFIEAVRQFLEQEQVVLDLRVADQEQTHRFLRDGEVLGCVSTQDQPMQGCRIAHLGGMDYRLLATPVFASRWFPDGLNIESVRRAPALIFGREDDLHNKVFRKALGEIPAAIPTHYVPSTEKFPEFIASSFAYGMLPDQQSAGLINSGQLIDLAPRSHIRVELYWHCWNLKSQLLENLTHILVSQAQMLLGI